jgi:hypothetical protein
MKQMHSIWRREDKFPLKVIFNLFFWGNKLPEPLFLPFKGESPINLSTHPLISQQKIVFLSKSCIFARF